MHHFERWQITLKLCQQEQEHGDDENYFPNECWALVFSCGFSSEVGLPLRGKRRPGEGGWGEWGKQFWGYGGREEDELYWRWWVLGDGTKRRKYMTQLFFHSQTCHLEVELAIFLSVNLMLMIIKIKINNS